MLCAKCNFELPLEAFPASSGRKRPCKSCLAAAAREYRKTHPEKKRNRNEWARARRADPQKAERLKAVRQDWYARKGLESQRDQLNRLRDRNPWLFRVRTLRGNISKQITEGWLRSAFEVQGGRCALSGREIDVLTLEVDHVIPRSRGGTDDLSNLRLVCREANAAKSGLTDEELVSLCYDITEAIGRAILRVESALACVGRAA